MWSLVALEIAAGNARRAMQQRLDAQGLANSGLACHCAWLVNNHIYDVEPSHAECEYCGRTAEPGTTCDGCGAPVKRRRPVK